jgi:hypothetical protein
MFTRRQALMSTLFGAGYVGLRALATGIPAAVLLNPRRVLADPSCAPGVQAKAQYIILSASGNGDPINANAPGTYDENPGIQHSADPLMVKTSFNINGQAYTAAAPWASLPQAVLNRLTFWHLMTNTPVHPNHPKVQKLMGATQGGEMLASLLAKNLAPCLGTIQSQPISLGASSPSEALTYGGQTLPIIPPLALKQTLISNPGALTNLQKLRDDTLTSLYAMYTNGASPAGQAYIDELVTSQAQVRNISQGLLSALDSIQDNLVPSQITAATTLIQMKVTPVIAVHFPFGGDNHRDTGFATETQQTVGLDAQGKVIGGVAAINLLMTALAGVTPTPLTDQVTFMSLNVFGRTVAAQDGRQHNPNWHTALTIGKGFNGGVVGGVMPMGSDYGAMAIDSKTGLGSKSGDITALNSLAMFGQTMLSAVGVDPSVISSEVMSGQVLSAALKTT